MTVIAAPRRSNWTPIQVAPPIPPTRKSAAKGEDWEEEELEEWEEEELDEEEDDNWEEDEDEI